MEKSFVEKYAIKHHITVEEAKKHAIVKIYEKWRSTQNVKIKRTDRTK